MPTTRSPRKPERTDTRAPFWKRLAMLVPLLFAGFCFYQGIPNGQRPQASQAQAVVAARPKASSQRKLETIAIKDIRPGMRVLAENPELAGQNVPQPQIDPANTRLVRLHQIKPDGHELTMETLVPLDSLHIAAYERINSDDRIHIRSLPRTETEEDIRLAELLLGHIIDLTLPELGAKGPATIVEISHCPKIESDDGTGRRLVTSTFRHEGARVYDLHIAGEPRPIGVTANHPIWSEDRGEFVDADTLRHGERLRRADGQIARVLSIGQRPGPSEAVFNLEIDGQHVYCVGQAGILVHNSYGLPQGLPQSLPIPQVSSSKLRNYVNDLYKGAKTPNPIGVGSTADALRNEMITNLPTHGIFHKQKAEQYSKGLATWLKNNPNASPQDRLVAQSLLNDLLSALAGN